MRDRCRPLQTLPVLAALAQEQVRAPEQAREWRLAQARTRPQRLARAVWRERIQPLEPQARVLAMRRARAPLRE